MPMNKRVYEQKIIDPQDFNKMISKLRGFFIEKGYLETFPQSRLSILAACEDPKTVRSFNFDGDIWPLPQTSQMHLEKELMMYADKLDGLFCLTASYRDEPAPIPGRHDLTFPMWEFEHKGIFSDLINTLSELAVYMGFIDSVDNIPIFTYDELCIKYGVNYLESDQETRLWKEYGDVVGIINFPERTSPFFNMKNNGYSNLTNEKIFNKCDFIICGQETFGSAERSVDVVQMRNSFHTISDGMYAKLLYNEFGKDRVEKELEEFLNLTMINRYGCGCGLTRLLRALKIKDLL